MSHLVTFEFPRDAAPEQMESLLLGLHGLLARGPFGRQRGTFEFEATETGTRAGLWVDRRDLADAVADLFAASFPGGHAAPVDANPPADLPHLARLTLGQSGAPLRSALPVPGIGGSLGALGALRGSQRAIVQLAVVPAGPLRAVPADGERAPARNSAADGALVAGGFAPFAGEPASGSGDARKGQGAAVRQRRARRR